MAHLRVAAADTVTAQDAMARIMARLRQDGHLAEPLEGGLGAALRDCDGLVALVDADAPLPTAAALLADAMDKPVLVLAGPAGVDLDLQGRVTQIEPAPDVQGWLDALPEFYERAHPFAGRLVRDLIPQLVKEAGHSVSFRALDDQDKPAFLKQKVLAEARELLEAERGAEKEEIADLLEALEALIRARAYDRDSLKQVKEAKRKRRGGFDRGWVVESTDPAADRAADAESASDAQGARQADTGIDAEGADQADAGTDTADDETAQRPAAFFEV